ncbi:MAG: M23 family metallopeptidase [Elusimicrobiota bacterium]
MKKFLKSLLRHKIYISFNPTSYIPSFTINFSFLSFIIIAIFVIIFISFSMFNHFKDIDYYALKIENSILRNKINKIMVVAEESLDYLEFVKKTESQISRIIGNKNNSENFSYYKSVGGPSYQQSLKLREALENIDYSKLNEKEVIDVYKTIKSESEERLSGYEEIINYITTKFSRQKSIPKGWPVEGNITSGYGYRVHPFTLSYDFHSGVDIANQPGVNIKATADGVVRYTGWAMGYGLCVIIDHGFGYSTLYGHLSQSLVKDGDIVKRGQIIALLGSTGTSTGPHLHYEVWEYGVPRNPIKFMNINDRTIVGGL